MVDTTGRRQASFRNQKTKDVYLSISDSNAPQARRNSLKKVLDSVNFPTPDAFELVSASNGKPRLICENEHLIGYSVSHARGIAKSIELIAVAENCDIGLDAEFWPSQTNDSDLLNSIACVADGKAIEKVGYADVDAGVALWIIKEAALKYSGDVDIAPQQLEVTAHRNGKFSVKSAARSLVPHCEVDVYLYLLNDLDAQRSPMLVGIAVNSWGEHADQSLRPILIQSANWTILPFLFSR